MEPSTARRPRGVPGRQAVLAARLGYVVVLALATLIPFRLDLTGPGLMERLGAALHPDLTARDLVDAARNLVLFAGWGTLWVTTARTARVLTAIRNAAVSGLLISGTVETLQLLSATRNPSVLDVLTNTAGALFGAIIVVAFIAVVEDRRGSRSFIGLPGLIFAGAYGAAACVEAWLPPLRGTTYDGVWGGPMARFEEAVRRFDLASSLSLPVADVILFLPAGVFAVAALVEIGFGYRRAAWTTVVAGALLLGPIEVARGFLAQPIEVGAFAVHAAAVAAGAWAAAKWFPPMTRRLRGRHRAAVFAFAYALLILLWAWRPYLPETDLGAIAEQLQPSRWLPLQAHRPQFDLFSVGDVLASFFLFLPLGCLLAVWPLRLRGALAYCLPAVYLAVAAELGQILVLGRYFDNTDILVGSAAAAIGWIVVRRAGYRPYGELREPPRATTTRSGRRWGG